MMYVFDLQKNLQGHSYVHPFILCHKVSKLHSIFSKSLKTVTIISAEALTAHQEQVLHNSTWEVKFQMLLEFQARNNHAKVTQGNATQLIYSWVRNERQLYKKDPQSCDPMHYKRLTELGFQYSLNKKQTTFNEGLVFLVEFSKQHGHCAVPTQYPQNQKLDHWVKYLRHESYKLFTTGTSKVKLEKAMELAELGFYKKKNGFEGDRMCSTSITRPLRKHHLWKPRSSSRMQVQR
jgi:hypothetical protein